MWRRAASTLRYESNNNNTECCQLYAISCTMQVQMPCNIRAKHTLREESMLLIPFKAFHHAMCRAVCPSSSLACQ